MCHTTTSFNQIYEFISTSTPFVITREFIDDIYKYSYKMLDFKIKIINVRYKPS